MANRTPTLSSRGSRWAASLRRLTVEQAGAALLFVAFAMPMMLGFAGLGLDVTMWYLDRRQNQTLADNIALAATIELNRDYSITDVTLEDLAKKEAARSGFAEDGTMRNIAVNRPPLNGPNAGDDAFVEIIVSEQSDFFFAGFALSGPITVEGRAVGSVLAGGEHCILALHNDMDDALEFSGTADANIGCGVASNSSSDQAIAIYGSATLTADPAQAYGDIHDPHNGLTTSTPPQPLSERLEDPYAGIDASIYADPSCSGGGVSPINSDKEMFPGNFCGGLKITGGATRFNPGIYVIDNGDLDISTGGNISVVNALPGEGVTFVLTATNASDIGNVKLTANGNIDLFAPGLAGHFPSNSAHPDHGAFPGMLMVQDSRAPCCQGANLRSNQVTGSPNMTLSGAIYFPSQELVFSGGSSNNGACTLLVGSKVTFNGTAYIENDPADCAAAGVDTFAQTRIRLVE